MPSYAVTLDFSTTITIEANSPEEAEEKGNQVDITEVFDNCGCPTVIHVEEE